MTNVICDHFSLDCENDGCPHSEPHLPIGSAGDNYEECTEASKCYWPDGKIKHRRVRCVPTRRKRASEEG